MINSGSGPWPRERPWPVKSAPACEVGPGIEEGHALAVALTLIMVSGFSMPLIGAWSDRCDGFLGIAGSRRPFILYGQLGVLVSIWMMMRAKRDAKALQTPLFLIQAADVSVPRKPIDLAKKLMNKANPKDTGLMHGYC